MSKLKVLKTDDLVALFEVRIYFACQAQGILHLPKSRKNVRVLYSSFKSAGRRGTFEEDLPKMHFAWQVQYKRHASDMLGGPGPDFQRGGAFWSIRSSGLLR